MCECDIRKENKLKYLKRPLDDSLSHASVRAFVCVWLSAGLVIISDSLLSVYFCRLTGFIGAIERDESSAR